MNDIYNISDWYFLPMDWSYVFSDTHELQVINDPSVEPEASSLAVNNPSMVIHDQITSGGWKMGFEETIPLPQQFTQLPEEMPNVQEGGNFLETYPQDSLPLVDTIVQKKRKKITDERKVKNMQSAKKARLKKSQCVEALESKISVLEKKHASLEEEFIKLAAANQTLKELRVQYEKTAQIVSEATGMKFITME